MTAFEEWLQEKGLYLCCSECGEPVLQEDILRHLLDAHGIALDVRDLFQEPETPAQGPLADPFEKLR